MVLNSFALHVQYITTGLIFLVASDVVINPFVLTFSHWEGGFFTATTEGIFF